MNHRALCCLAILLLPAWSARADCSVATGPVRHSLLELYSSEGCSSCPPADHWLSGLAGTQKRVVPLAFHVDYWNRLGWVDRYARTDYAARQRWLAGVSGARTVYTPQFMLDGKDWQAWRSGLPKAGNEQAVAEIRQLVRKDAARLFLALYENNLASRVEAGENAGRLLRHDFVVRQLVGPIQLPASGTLPIRQAFALDNDWKRIDLGVVAFIQDIGTGEVYQAIGRPYCGG